MKTKKLSDLTPAEQWELGQKYKRFQRKFVKGLTDEQKNKGIDLGPCRAAFMKKYNLER